MSQAQYTAIRKTRLIDLGQLPAGLLIQYLSDKPDWEQKAIWRLLSKGMA
ncbi:hypothetical protein [Vibrio parahaemolyticus]|nr:hypothetical protein [Vibrio parahaemolyticus]